MDALQKGMGSVLYAVQQVLVALLFDRVVKAHVQNRLDSTVSIKAELTKSTASQSLPSTATAKFAVQKVL